MYLGNVWLFIFFVDMPWLCFILLCL
jgi:hypothetical protein